MTVVAIILCVAVACLGWMQLLPGLIFARLLFQPKPAVLEDALCPKAAVLLSVRGNDPFLVDCIESLLRQDYPTYDIRIVVDHETDPAWSVIQDVVARNNPSNVTISVLGEKFGTCTLKPNSLLQAISQLDSSYEVIAILDSDAVTHPTWLKELVAPFQDETIGVTSGNRWYMPQQATLGALVRYTWNAAAVVQMYFNHFTWGGSVAIRGSVIRDSKLQDRWRHSIAEDTAIYDEVKTFGLHAAFVPSLMIVNRESCGLFEFFVWMKRQLMVGRLQHSGWHIVFWHAMVTSVLLTASAVLFVVALATGNLQAVAWVGSGLLAYVVMLAFLLFILEAGVRKTARHRGQATNWISIPTLGKLAIALPLTQILYSVAIPSIRFMRDVTWRGIQYRVEGPWNVRMVSYQPFQSSKQNENSQTSL